jgi:ParB family chromosome partitioning protein
MTHEQIAQRVGKSRTSVTNTLRLLKLPESIQTALAQGVISEGHARPLLTLATPQAQIAVFQAILKKELNVRQTEDLVRKMVGQRPSVVAQPTSIPEVTALEDRLQQHLGTRVSLNPRKKGGTLVIHYYSDEELNSLVDKLIGNI